MFEENEAEKMTEDRIVKNVPRTYQATAKKLIWRLKDFAGISWNAKGEMVVDGKNLPVSNLSVLVKDIIRKAKHEVIQLEESLSSNILVKLNFLAVSSKMLKSRESWVKGNVNLPFRVNLRLNDRGSIGTNDWTIIYNSGQRVVSEAYPSPKKITERKRKRFFNKAR